MNNAAAKAPTPSPTCAFNAAAAFPEETGALELEAAVVVPAKELVGVTDAPDDPVAERVWLTKVVLREMVVPVPTLPVPVRIAVTETEVVVVAIAEVVLGESVVMGTVVDPPTATTVVETGAEPPTMLKKPEKLMEASPWLI